MGLIPLGAGSGLQTGLRAAVEEDPGILQQALTTLGRPGFAFRNLLAGDLEGALGQSLVVGSQVASAPFTGGLSLVDPDVSLLGAIEGVGDWLGFDTPGVSDLAPRETELEFSDLLDRYGYDTYEPGWKRLATDIAGGIVTDPTSLISGGFGGVGRKATGLVAGTPWSVLQRTKRAMSATPSGRKLVKEGLDAGLDLDEIARETLEGALGRAGGPIVRAPGVHKYADAPIFQFANRDELVQATEQLVKEGTLSPFTFRIGLTPKLSKTFAMPGASLDTTGGRLGAEIGGAAQSLINPFNRHFLVSAIGGAAGGLPGAVAARAALLIKPFDDSITKITGEFTKNLIDKFNDVNLPHGVRSAVRLLMGDVKATASEETRKATSIFGGTEVGNPSAWLPEQQSLLTEHSESVNNYLRKRRVLKDQADKDLRAEGGAQGDMTPEVYERRLLGPNAAQVRKLREGVQASQAEFQNLASQPARWEVIGWQGEGREFRPGEGLRWGDPPIESNLLRRSASRAEEGLRYMRPEGMTPERADVTYRPGDRGWHPSQEEWAGVEDLAQRALAVIRQFQETGDQWPVMQFTREMASYGHRVMAEQIFEATTPGGRHLLEPTSVPGQPRSIIERLEATTSVNRGLGAGLTPRRVVSGAEDDLESGRAALVQEAEELERLGHDTEEALRIQRDRYADAERRTAPEIMRELANAGDDYTDAQLNALRAEAQEALEAVRPLRRVPGFDPQEVERLGAHIRAQQAQLDEAYKVVGPTPESKKFKSLVHRATNMPGEEEIRNIFKALVRRDSRLSGDALGNPLTPERLDEAVDWYVNLVQRIQQDHINYGKWGQLPRDLITGDRIMIKKGKGKGKTWEVKERHVDGAYVLQNSEGGQMRRPLKPIRTTRTKKKTKADRLGAKVAKPGDYEILARPGELGQALRVDDQFYSQRTFQPWVERELGDEAETLRAGYRRRRKIEGRDDFEEAARKKLLSLHPAGSAAAKRIEKMLEQPWAKPLAEGGHGLSVTSLPVLALQRLRNHAEDVARWELNKIAKSAPEFGKYIESVQVDLRKVLGGKGGLPSEAFRQFSQINRRWKGLLTSANPAFHVRNYMGTLFQTMHDPSMGVLDGLRVWLETGLQTLPAMGRYLARAMGSDSRPVSVFRLTQFVDAAYGDRKAFAAIKNKVFATLPNGRKVTGHEILRIANGRVMQQNASQREVVDDLLGRKLAETLKGSVEEAQPRLIKAVDWLNKKGADAASYVEDRMRLGTMLQMVTNGIHPREAADRVNRAFVNYEVNSVADYWLRQFFPFIRFPLATLGPSLRAVRDRPLYRGVPRTIAAQQGPGEEPQGGLRRPGQESDPIYPEDVRRGFSVPLGQGKFMRGLGMPLQSTDELLRALPSTTGDAVQGGRRMMASLQPALSSAIGAVTDRNLYWGGKFWKSRPVDGPLGQLMEGAGMGERGRDGVFRASPAASNAIDALPFARQLGYAKELSRTLESGGMRDAGIKFLTGFQVKDTLTERELGNLADDFFERRARKGDLSVYSRFYQQGEVDLELQRLIKLAAKQKERAQRTRAERRRRAE